MECRNDLLVYLFFSTFYAIALSACTLRAGTDCKLPLGTACLQIDLSGLLLFVVNI